MGVLRTILIIVVCYYVFKFFAKLLLPFVLKSVVNKAQQNMKNQFGQQNNKQQYKEGEVHIKGENKSTTHHVEAEDIEFEEVE